MKTNILFLATLLASREKAPGSDLKHSHIRAQGGKVLSGRLEEDRKRW